MPGFDRLHDLRGDLEGRVDFTVDRLRAGALTNLEDSPLLRGQHHGDHLMGAELLPQGPPRGLLTPIPKAFLDGHQEVVSSTPRLCNVVLPAMLWPKPCAIIGYSSPGRGTRTFQDYPTGGHMITPTHPILNLERRSGWQLVFNRRRFSSSIACVGFIWRD